MDFFYVEIEKFSPEILYMSRRPKPWLKATKKS